MALWQEQKVPVAGPTGLTKLGFVKYVFWTAITATAAQPTDHNKLRICILKYTTWFEMRSNHEATHPGI